MILWTGSQIPSLVLNTRQQQEDQSSLSTSRDEENISLENITITDEVLPENKELASEETESPGLDSEDKPGVIPEEKVEDFIMTWPLREELKTSYFPNHYKSAEEFFGEAYRNACRQF